MNPQLPPTLNRSCEGCRAHKVRCLPDPAVPNQCERCAKTMKACIFAAPQKRRARRKTGSRVAMLQRDIQALRSLLESQFHSRGSNLDDIQPPHDSATQPSEYDSNFSILGDVIDRNVLSVENAATLVRFFSTELAQSLPVVVLPVDIDIKQLRHTKPMLFLSIIAAAALTADPPLATVLNAELVTTFADVFFIRGEKSLELIQCLLLMIIFYFPPNGSRQSQYYQYTHIAATMAFELGLTSDFRQESDLIDDDAREAFKLEQARAILGCHHFASNIAVKTHRLNFLPMNCFTSRCVDLLAQSELRTDRTLAAWFKLQQIVDDFSASCSLDNMPSNECLINAQVQQRVHYFQSRMFSWRRGVAEEALTSWMMIEYHFASLTMLELAIGEAYRDPEATRRKYYTLPPPNPSSKPPETSPPVSAAVIDIALKRLEEAYHIMDVFLSFDTEMVRKSPNVTFTRVMAALTTLLKVFHFIHSDPIKNVIGLLPSTVSFYLDSIRDRLLQASDNNVYKIPFRWATVVCKKGQWFDEFQFNQSASNTEVPGDDSVSSISHPPLSANTHVPCSTRSHDVQDYAQEQCCAAALERSLRTGLATDSTATYPSISSNKGVINFDIPPELGFASPVSSDYLAFQLSEMTPSLHLPHWASTRVKALEHEPAVGFNHQEVLPIENALTGNMNLKWSFPSWQRKL
ncbi:hypothetical protein N7451_004244 [Penicillium sp. IBT 35674x]|nr:hypothetical protein N7451_004244 [Penicillium sp. IBT 35674x]